MTTQLSSHLIPVGFGRGRRTNTIAVIQTATAAWKAIPPHIHQWGLGERLDLWTRDAADGCLIGAEESGFNLLWHYWRKHETPEDVVRSLFPDRADGAIILAPRDEHSPLIAHLTQMEVPFVITYARHPDPRIPWVACDNASGAAQAVRHLAALGHQRIGFIGGPPPVADMQERKQGYLEGMEAADLTVEAALVQHAVARMDIEDVKPLASLLLRRPDRPSAIVCATDLIAVSASEAAWQMGLRVPQDLAVVGFDDSEFVTQTIPHLTSVHQPVIDIASQASYLVACAVTGREPETASWHIELPVTLVVRESCGAHAEADPASQAQTTRRDLEWRLHQLSATREEMREILSIASHDLRSPLVTIKGFAANLEDKYGHLLDDRGRRYLVRIRHNADHMDELIENLLAVSRSHNQPLNLGRIAIRDLINSVVHDLEGLVAQAKAHVAVQPDMPIVTGDVVALRQVFVNLLTNALNYMGDQPRPEIHIGHTSRPGEHEFFVQDNGVGIAPEHHDRIFRLFRRGPDADTDGAGVGLTTAKAVVLRHAGRIWVESQKGHGATFRFTLPQKEDMK